MAAPINVRVEAVASKTVQIRWTSPATSGINIYQSTLSNTGFALAVTNVATAVEVTNIAGLVPAIFYHYRLSDDGGLTNSLVVSVQTYTECTTDLPRPPVPIAFDSVTPEMFNQLVEEVANQDQNDRQVDRCIVCSTNGAIVVDCGSGCRAFRVLMDEDINSISFIYCSYYFCPDIEFIIPAGETFKICGWPDWCGFTKDECFNAPIVGPASFFTTGLNEPLDTPGVIEGTETCPCPVDQVTLAIKCCSASCVLASGNTPVVLKACSGFPPYKWTFSGNITLGEDRGEFTQVNWVSNPVVATVTVTDALNQSVAQVFS